MNKATLKKRREARALAKRKEKLKAYFVQFMEDNKLPAPQSVSVFCGGLLWIEAKFTYSYVIRKPGTSANLIRFVNIEVKVGYTSPEETEISLATRVEQRTDFSSAASKKKEFSPFNIVRLPKPKRGELTTNPFKGNTQFTGEEIELP